MALPALIALKGIMFLSQTGKSLVNLVAAIAALRGTGGDGTSLLTGGKGLKAPLLSKLSTLPVIGTVATVLTLSGDTKVQTPEEQAKSAAYLKTINPKTGYPYNMPALGSGVFANGKGFAGNQTNNVTINVQSADPKATVDAVSKYVKTNGALPNTWNFGR
jgi:hypothetical protein